VKVDAEETSLLGLKNPVRAPYKTNVTEEITTSIIWVTRISELGNMLAVTSNRRKLRKNTGKTLDVTSNRRTLRKNSN
jgi:hypothetical protein